MNELIKITINKNQDVVISGRELHEFLEVKTPYTQWLDRMVGYGFSENEDYVLVSQKCETNNPKNPFTTIQDHAVKLDMAKEITMIQRSEKGKQARRYFLQLEKEWNSPEKIMARALKFAEMKLSNLQIENEQQKLKIQKDKPKVLFAEALEVSDNTILIGELAKLLRQNGIDIGQNRLFERLRSEGYLIKKKGESYNLPTQRAMEQELFQIKTRTINNPDGSIRTTRTTKITGKGQVYLINKFKEEI